MGSGYLWTRLLTTRMAVRAVWHLGLRRGTPPAAWQEWRVLDRSTFRAQLPVPIAPLWRLRCPVGSILQPCRRPFGHAEGATSSR
jgi:hypothetical protein